MSATKPVGSGIVHHTRPDISRLIGKTVIVTHHDEEKHGTWEGELEYRYLKDVEKSENFVYVVEGMPCEHCQERCTDDSGVGCDEFRADREGKEHSSQPNLIFTAHAVYSRSGNVIVLG